MLILRLILHLLQQSYQFQHLFLAYSNTPQSIDGQDFYYCFITHNFADFYQAKPFAELLLQFSTMLDLFSRFEQGNNFFQNQTKYLIISFLVQFNGAIAV